MQLTNTFSISQPVERAWEVITDLERVAPCLPGAALLGVEGDDYRGAVKIKVGPVTAQYEGVARFAERDDDAHHAVLRAEGRDVHGQGNAAATIDVRLVAQGTGTEVRVDTDLELAGRVAQFGRGVIADVSGKLIGQFAARLEQEMSKTSSPAPAPAAGPATATAARARSPQHRRCRAAESHIGRGHRSAQACHPGSRGCARSRARLAARPARPFRQHRGPRPGGCSTRGEPRPARRQPS